MQAHLVLSRSPDAISCELDTGTAILDSGTNFYFALNSTGALVWDMLPASPGDITAQLAAQFKVESEIVAKDVALLLEQMQHHNLIIIGEMVNADEPQTA